MVDQKIEQETTDVANPIENALNALWEKAREASLLISTLNEEKKALLRKIETLEEELVQSKNEAIIKQSNLDQIRNELEENGKSASENFIALDHESKQHLQVKLQNLITKIDQYLSP